MSSLPVVLSNIHLVQDRMEIEESVRLKKEARQQLVTIYSGSDHDAKLTSKEVCLVVHSKLIVDYNQVELIIDSLADSNSFLTANVTPVEKMISYLQEARCILLLDNVDQRSVISTRQHR